MVRETSNAQSVLVRHVYLGIPVSIGGKRDTPTIRRPGWEVRESSITCESLHVRPILVHHVYSPILVLHENRGKHYPPSRHHRRGCRCRRRGMRCGRHWRGCWGMRCGGHRRGCRGRRCGRRQRLRDPRFYRRIDILIRQSISTCNQPSCRYRSARCRDHPKHEGFSLPKMPPSLSYHTPLLRIPCTYEEYPICGVPFDLLRRRYGWGCAGGVGG